MLKLLTAAMAAAQQPKLQTEGGPSFGDGTFQPNDMVTIHNVSNLEDGLRAKIIAYDPAEDKQLYVVKDSAGSIWGLRTEKLKPMKVLELEELGDEWQEVPEGVVVPGGASIKMDLSTGRKLARRLEPEL